MEQATGLLLLDTDMLVLLLASDRLGEVAELLGFELSQIRRLAAVPFQVERSASFRNTYGEAVLRKILPRVREIPEAPMPVNIDLLDRLNSVVDPGEAQLLCLAVGNENTLLSTGDLRAIRAIAKTADHATLGSLSGRIVCLEAVLWLLVARSGAANTRQSFMPVINHKTLSVVLSAHSAEDDSRCFDALRSYYRALLRDAEGLLFNPAPGEIG